MYRNVTVPYTNIEKPTQTTVEVTISPNPFNGFAILKIEGGKLSTYSLDIYDVSGKIIRSYANQRSDQLIINRGELVAGTYFYKVSSSSMEHTANGKLVISE